VGYRIRTAQSTSDPGVDFVGAGVAVPIPVASARRGSRMVAAATAGQRADEAAFDAWLLQADAQLEDAWAAWTRAADRARARESLLLPDARRTLEALLSDYRVGRTDFGALIAAEVVVLDLERETIVSATETRLQAARVAELLAIPLDEVMSP
jgi:outer membrane protein TolC